MLFFAFSSLLGGTRKDAGYKIGPASMKWYETVNNRSVWTPYSVAPGLMIRPALKKALDRLQQEEAAAKSRI